MNNPFDDPRFETIWLASDLESLSKITFVKILEKAKRKYKYPKDFFISLGILIPDKVKTWGDIEEYYLLRVKQIVYASRKETDLKGIIITSEGRIIEHGGE
tara:strand:+ start:2051 stop:2353 length:303 start_codon:yes stop_codon:yes gene_type:complete